MKQKIFVILQARMGSSRLPGKVMAEITGMPLIEVLIKRLRKANLPNGIIVATSTNENNDQLCRFLKGKRQNFYRGSEADVLSRYFFAAKTVEADTIVRITGDCPLVDPTLLDQIINEHIKIGADYTSNIMPQTFPDGLDVEVFSYSALEKAFHNAHSDYDREHVTPFFRQGLFTTHNIEAPTNYSEMRWTVDEEVDLTVVRNIFNFFAPDIYFSWKDVIDLTKSNPDFFLANAKIESNEGSIMGTGQKLWRRAKTIIPNGSMLLSKNPDLHLPNHWPAYYSKTSGCNVWDMDNKRYIDVYLMGVGTNILGYSNPEVDQAVINAIKSGNLSTLNAPEEVWLSERLLELNPWAKMVRLARTGGEANSIAIRIARAATGKDGVAVCGYHGWHDWFLSANLAGSNNLKEHLLPGLTPTGVPKALYGTVFPFNYNDFESLEKIVQEKKVGVIKMEVMRNSEPTNNFLTKVRELATNNGVVLIFDECTSGFRETDSGLYKKYGVQPDIAVYGKTLGNGYAITAVIGKAEFFEACKNSFISSTFWTERIGPVAALKTLEVMDKEKPWKYVTDLGLYLRTIWQQVADANDIKIEIKGIPSLSSFTIQSEHANEYKTLISQEMLKKGYLAGTTTYVCTAHTKAIFDDYADHLNSVFRMIKECEEGRNVIKFLDGPAAQMGFKRIN